MEKSNSSSSGITFWGLLCLLFIGLKLTKYIDWSWWWVTSPVWLPIVVGGSILIILQLIKHFLKKKVEKDLPKMEPRKRSLYAQRLEEAMRQAETRKKYE